jgi:hypothetical protein
MKQYWLRHTIRTRAHQNAQFKMRTNKSPRPLVHTGNLNVGVKGEYAKQGIVDASRKVSNVPAHAFATKIVWQTQTTVNELSVLRINFLLVLIYASFVLWLF